MKVNLSNDAALKTSTAAARTERVGVTPAAASTTGRDDASGVPLSVSASARALDAASSGSGIDPVKVAAMKAAIANGTFSVNAGAIADKLLANAQEFLSRSRG